VATFSTADFPRTETPGQATRSESSPRRSKTGRLCRHSLAHESYLESYGCAGLEVVEMRKPLATGHEPLPWVSETRIAPGSFMRFAVELKDSAILANRWKIMPCEPAANVCRTAVVKLYFFKLESISCIISDFR